MGTKEIAEKIKEAWKQGNTGEVAQWLNVVFIPTDSKEMIAVLDELKKQVD